MTLNLIKPTMILLFLLPLTLHAQTKPGDINLGASSPALYSNDSLGAIMARAGSELTKYYKVHSIGTAIAVTGGVTFAVGESLLHSSKTSDVLVGVGGALGIAGIFVNIASHAHIRRAGLILQGNGIAIPIRGRH